MRRQAKPDRGFGLRRLSLILQLQIVCVPALLAESAVSGRVLDQSRYPLPGAVVTLNSLSDPQVTLKTSAARDGRYSFQEVPNGVYSLETSYNGFVGIRYGPIRVRFPLPVQRDFELPIAPGNEGGVQFYAEVVGELKYQGRWLAHATVCFSRNSAPNCVNTNGIGQYYIALPPGVYDGSVQVEDKVLWRGHLDLGNLGEYRNYIRLDKTSSTP